MAEFHIVLSHIYIDPLVTGHITASVSSPVTWKPSHRLVGSRDKQNFNAVSDTLCLCVVIGNQHVQTIGLSLSFSALTDLLYIALAGSGSW